MQSNDTETQAKKPFLRRLINGELGLAKTFWIFYIIIGFLIGIIITIFGEYLVAKNLLIFVAVPQVIYGLIILLALFRASKLYQGPKIWVILMWITIAIGLFFSIITSLSPLIHEYAMSNL